jgi:hypothetical protein
MEGYNDERTNHSENGREQLFFSKRFLAFMGNNFAL